MNTVLCNTKNINNQLPLTIISEIIDDLAPLNPSIFLNDFTEAGNPGLGVLDSS